MRRIDSIEDQMQGQVTYEIDENRCVRFSEEALREFGLEAMLRGSGVDIPTERLPVYQFGEMIGTVPATFDPMCIKSNSFLYRPRPYDFKREGEKWIAHKSLGVGDISAIQEFWPLEQESIND